MRKVGSFLPHPPRAVARWVRLTLAFGVGAPVASAGAGCAAPAKETGLVTEIDPPEAYNDATARVALLGELLRPPLDIDTHSGAASAGGRPFAITLEPMAPIDDRYPVEATAVEWISAGEIDAHIPAGLLPGSYRVAVANLRGEPVESRAVFRSLGPDNDPPRVRFVQPAPGTAVSPDTDISLVASVDDGRGQIPQGHWSATSDTLGSETGDCDIDPSEKLCRFSVRAPRPRGDTEPVAIEVHVEDAVGRPASAALEVIVAYGPEIRRISPPSGPTTGGTAVTVQGDRLVPGLSQIYIDGSAIGGLVDGDTITAITRPHPPGMPNVTVGNGDGTSNSLKFTFVPPPTLRIVSPTHAPSEAGTQIVVAGNDFTTSTRFFVVVGDDVRAIATVEANMATAPPYAVFSTENRYILTLGPGSGTVTLRAHDDVGGDTELRDAFTYDAPSP